MTKWIRIRNAEGKSGVRYREHATRRHGKTLDRYYVLTYWYKGKTVTEAVGWASEKITPTLCFEKLAQIKHNQKTGEGPCTLAELKAEQEVQREAEQKLIEDEKKRTFKAFFDNVYFSDAKTRWKKSTAQKADEHVRLWIHPVTGDTPFKDLDLTHAVQIKANLAEAGRSPRTMQYVFRTFAMVWNAAIDHGLTSAPCPTKSSSFRLPKIDNERQRYLTVEEEEKLLAEVLKKSKQAHDMALVSIDSGLRFGEVAALTWGCVLLKRGVLYVIDTKSGHDRHVPMTSRLRDLFESLPAGGAGDLVFPARDGKVMTEAPSSFRAAVKDSGLNDGITNKKLRASFHTLRHTYASRLVQSGASLYHIQRLLGHSTPLMTARYSKLADGDLHQAVKKMELAKNGASTKGKVIAFPQH